MKVSVSRSDLLRALSRCVSVVSRNPVNPIFGCVKLSTSTGRLEYEATSDSTTINTSGNINADVTANGATLVGAVTLLDRIRKLEEETVHISQSGTQLTIRGGKRKFSVSTIPADEYPQIQKPDGWTTKFDAAALTTAIRAVNTAASADAGRPHLNGVGLLFDGQTVDIECTDGHRLHLVTLEHSDSIKRTVLIPEPAVKALLALLKDQAEVTLTGNDSTITFAAGDDQLTVRMPDAVPPPVHQVIPKHSTTFIPVCRERLIRALGSMVGNTTLVAENGVVRVDSRDVEDGDAYDELSTVGDVRCDGVSFSPRYMIDALAAHADEDVIIGCDGQLDPIVVRGAVSNSTVCVVMPVRR